MVTDDSETFRLDNLESEIVGGTCATFLKRGMGKCKNKER